MSLHRLVIAAGVSALVACGGSSTGPSPTDGGSGGGSSGGGAGGGGTALSCPATLGIVTRAQGSLVASINGNPWIADCIGVLISTTTPNVISITGGDLATGSSFQTFAFATTRAVGNDSIGPTSGLNASLSQGISGSAHIWMASLLAGSGTAVITSLTNNGVAGTFSFVMQPAPGSPATGTKNVSGGSFNLTW